MQQLTEQGRQRIAELAQRYSVSADAVLTLLQSLVNSNGTMAQFNHRELGGGGQWMRGGMTMVGDMFNRGLKAKVEGLCSELSQLLAQQPFVPFPPSFQSQSQAGRQQQQGGLGSQPSSPYSTNSVCTPAIIWSRSCKTAGKRRRSTGPVNSPASSRRRSIGV